MDQNSNNNDEDQTVDGKTFKDGDESLEVDTALVQSLLLDSSSKDEPKHDEIHDVRKLIKSIGNTPLIPVSKLVRPHNFTCQIYAKCEFRNPSGSIWDRFVVHKIEEGKKNGHFNRDTHLVTGGNMEICKSLAWAGATGNFPVTVLPGELLNDSQSLILKSLGATIILSYSQDPLMESSNASLKNHIKQLQDTSGIVHYPILPATDKKTENENCFDSLINEIVTQNSSTETNNNNVQREKQLLDFDTVVCAGINNCLMKDIFKALAKTSQKILRFVGAQTNVRQILDNFEDNSEEDEITVKWVTVTEAETYDMARRLVREEGLFVGPLSGAAMAAAIRAIEDYELGNDNDAKVLVILPDSLSSTSEFLSTEWLVQKGYYNPAQLDSLFWWYEMAIENLSPPITLLVSPGTPVKDVWKVMTESSSTDRAVVVSKEGNNIIGVVNYESLIASMNSGKEEEPVEEGCCKQFDVIDSKASFPELITLLRKYNWIINIHRLSFHMDCNKPECPYQSEEIIGAVTLADFMKYKKKVEAHHLTEYGISMSDGIPSEVWLEKFKEQVRSSDEMK